MRCRQNVPREWLIVSDREAIAAAARLPAGSGVLLLQRLAKHDRRWLRGIARARQLTVVSEKQGVALRVHDVRELRRALLDRTSVILLSPIFPTRTHPDWPAMPRMRAGTLARLGGRRLIALGGMNRARYAKVARLGFIGWAGISAWS